MTNTPKVYSKRRRAALPPKEAVYVGRPSPWGNIFIVDVHGTQAECVEHFRNWVWLPAQKGYRAKARHALRGKDLVCWCQSPNDQNPLPCHATILLEVANGEQDEST